MTVKPLLPQQTVTASGLAPSRDLVEIIQRLVLAVNALEARLDAAAAVANATGGATVDTQARAQLAAIKTALTG
jgi:hypothetical protein